MNSFTNERLAELMALPLEAKVLLTKQRIRDLKFMQEIMVAALQREMRGKRLPRHRRIYKISVLSDSVPGNMRIAKYILGVFIWSLRGIRLNM